MEKFAREFPECKWVLPLEVFVERMVKNFDTAPGPDGIPYSAYGKKVGLCGEIVYECYSDWLTNGFLPEGFNHAYLWLLPKVAAEDGKGINMCDTKTLSGSNTDAKILAGALGCVL